MLIAEALSKFAEAAGKKMRKLRRNWSLKKNDISRSLSRIRKTSASATRPSMDLLRRSSKINVSTAVSTKQQQR